MYLHPFLVIRRELWSGCADLVQYAGGVVKRHMDAHAAAKFAVYLRTALKRQAEKATADRFAQFRMRPQADERSFSVPTRPS